MIDQATVNHFIEHEAFVPHAYQDSRGFWTIGIGRLIDKRKGGRITREEAIILLDNDVFAKEADLDRNLPWWRSLDIVRRTVLLDMCFNMGISGLLTFKNSLALIRSGSYHAAGTNMRKSLWYTQVGNRAERLVRMMQTGQFVPKWW
jgi:lysozyme